MMRDGVLSAWSGGAGGVTGGGDGSPFGMNLVVTGQCGRRLESAQLREG
jgi:hypothetical protein